MLLLDNDDVAKVLTIEDCLEALEDAFRDYGLKQAVNRPRSHSYAPQAEQQWYLLKTMDAVFPRYDIAGIRLTSELLTQSVVDGKQRRVMLPGPNGRWTELILLFRMSTSEPIAIVPGGHLQRMRVGATAAICAKYLARKDSRVAGLLGTGGIGGPQLEALAKTCSLKEIRVYSPTGENLRSFVAYWSGRLNVEIRGTRTAREAVEGADIVGCATNSLEPVLNGDWLSPGTHVNSVTRYELDNETIRRADVIIVRSHDRDSHWVIGDELPEEVKRDQSGDDSILGRAQTLGEIVAGRAAGRTSDDQITLFSGSGLGSAGLGLQLIAVAARAYEKAKAQGLGRDFPAEWFTQSIHT
ncbi:MAG: ornithine cyclodeaminase family protein [Betaproteobacteria bacterium]|nr:ornithine cyclodeaminase family protein [Betaproteobacteria bacterium]